MKDFEKFYTLTDQEMDLGRNNPEFSSLHFLNIIFILELMFSTLHVFSTWTTEIHMCLSGNKEHVSLQHSLIKHVQMQQAQVRPGWTGN